MSSSGLGLLGLMTRLGSYAVRSSLTSRSPAADILRFLLWAYYEIGSSLLVGCGDEVGWSALHTATSSGASTDALRALLKIRGPEALVARTEGGGLTPLHVACDRPRAPRCRSTTAAGGGMTCCIGGAVDMDEGERTALFLLARNPTSASFVSAAGDTPLHVACRRGLSPLVIRCLLHADPGAAVRVNRMGRSPLLIAAGMWPGGGVGGVGTTGGGGDGDGLDGGEGGIFGNSPSLRDEEEDEDYCDDEEIDYAWTVIRMLLLAGTPGRDAGPGYRWDDDRYLLHSAVGLGLPIDVVRFVLRTFPHQIRQRRESDGRTPLAVAAAAPQRRSGGGVEDHHRDELIAELIRSYPGAANVPDRDGRLPLHLAVLAAAGGDDDDASWSDDGGGVGRIFRASPGALAVRDPVTRLFPFMLAALDRESGRGSSELSDVCEACPVRPYEPTFSVVERLLGNFVLVFGTDGTNHDSWDVVFGGGDDDCCGNDDGLKRSSGGVGVPRGRVAGEVGVGGRDDRVSLVYSLLRHNPSLVRPQMVDM